jgi:hypothetical protein
MERCELSAEVLKVDDRPETWLVEAIDSKHGDVYGAQFYGPGARERATEYAGSKFAEHRVRR